MARVRWNTATLPDYVSSMYSNTEDWQYIRKAPQLISFFASMGDDWVDDLNNELHAAQAARKQKVEDGYKYAISVDDDRIRMRLWAFTARAMVHEAKHQSILKLMRTSGFDTNRHGKAQWDWGKRKRKPSGSRRNNSGGRRGTGESSRPPRSSSRGRAMDPAKAARMRRQLATLDLLATDKGATEPERQAASERARRFRTELGE